MADIIVGLDAATKEKQVGLARAERVGATWRATDIVACGMAAPLGSTLLKWVSEADRCLIAIDAPLGWPDAMGAALVSHRAGAAISVPPNELFRRETDRFIARRFGKTPLDVGADRIARTAVAALSYLREFGQAVGHPIPLLWSPSEWEGCCAIEVYPAATMLRHELSVPGYKKAAGIRARAALGEFLCRELDMSSPLECERLGVDALDAALCIVAGRDFVEGRALPPEREALARKEGWIWA